MQKFCLAAQNGKIAETSESVHMPLIEIADVNRDGMVDIAFMTPAGELAVLYNKYEAPGPKDENLCAKAGQTKPLATMDIFATFPFSKG